MNLSEVQSQSKCVFIIRITFQCVLLHLELSEVVKLVAVIFRQLIMRGGLFLLRDTILRWRFVVWAWSNLMTPALAAVWVCRFDVTVTAD